MLDQEPVFLLLIVYEYEILILGTCFEGVCIVRAHTQSAGLAATRPVAEALKDEYVYFAWLLRYEAFLRFGYDPDAAFPERTGEYGFRE